MMAVVGWCGLSLMGACRAGEPPMQAAVHTETGQVIVTERERTVLQYNWTTVDPPKGLMEKVPAGARRYALPRRNYIHPLYGLDGEVLTLDWSTAHPHHRGIYWAWPEVDWKGQRADWHALQGISSRPVGEVKLEGGDDFAQVVATNEWLWAGKDGKGAKTPIVREVATIRVWRAGKGGQHVDLTFRFEAIADDVKLARRGTGAYGGLNIRLSPVKDLQLTHHADPAGAEPRRAWSDSVGIRQGGTRPMGLAVFEKATNPCYPGDWVKYEYLPWFQPTFPAKGTRHVLSEGKPLVLAYRLWIRRGGKATDAEYTRQWKAFNKAEPKTK